MTDPLVLLKSHRDGARFRFRVPKALAPRSTALSTHLYQLIHYRDRFAVPSSFRKAIPTRAIPKVHRRKPSGTARKSVSQPTSLLQLPWQANAYRAITKAICAVQAPRRMRAAFLNCSGSCTPLAYFFFLLKKSRSPKASEATNEAFRTKRFRKVSHVGAGWCVSKFSII